MSKHGRTVAVAGIVLFATGALLWSAHTRMMGIGMILGAVGVGVGLLSSFGMEQLRRLLRRKA